MMGIDEITGVAHGSGAFWFASVLRCALKGLMLEKGLRSIEVSEEEMLWSWMGPRDFWVETDGNGKFVIRYEPVEEISGDRQGKGSEDE